METAARVKDLEEALANATNEREELEERMGRIGRELEETEDERDAAAARIAELMSALKTASEEEKGLRETIEEMERGVEEANADREDLEDRLEQLQRDLRDAEKALWMLLWTMRGREVDNARLERVRSESMELVRQAQEEVESWRAEEGVVREQLEKTQRVGRREREVEEMRSEMEVLERKLEEAREEVEEMRMQNDDANDLGASESRSTAERSLNRLSLVSNDSQGKNLVSEALDRINELQSLIDKKLQNVKEMGTLLDHANNEVDRLRRENDARVVESDAKVDEAEMRAKREEEMKNLEMDKLWERIKGLEGDLENAMHAEQVAKRGSRPCGTKCEGIGCSKGSCRCASVATSPLAAVPEVDVDAIVEERLTALKSQFELSEEALRDKIQQLEEQSQIGTSSLVQQLQDQEEEAKEMRETLVSRLRGQEAEAADLRHQIETLKQETMEAVAKAKEMEERYVRQEEQTRDVVMANEERARTIDAAFQAAQQEIEGLRAEVAALRGVPVSTDRQSTSAESVASFGAASFVPPTPPASIDPVSSRPASGVDAPLPNPPPVEDLTRRESATAEPKKGGFLSSLWGSRQNTVTSKSAPPPPPATTSVASSFFSNLVGGVTSVIPPPPTGDAPQHPLPPPPSEFAPQAPPRSAVPPPPPTGALPPPPPAPTGALPPPPPMSDAIPAEWSQNPPQDPQSFYNDLPPIPQDYARQEHIPRGEPAGHQDADLHAAYAQQEYNPQGEYAPHQYNLQGEYAQQDYNPQGEYAPQDHSSQAIPQGFEYDYTPTEAENLPNDPDDRAAPLPIYTSGSYEAPLSGLPMTPAHEGEGGEAAEESEKKDGWFSFGRTG
ncbi:hypothetical protein BC829DRAFT_393211 [Chytridium lagenaria]|nr:hypothetical protein BC829DRAFT_393211 [Chytridium lagenaria]